jgi:hypothetical protein
VTLSLFLLRITITTLHLELGAMFNTLPSTLASILRRLYGGNCSNGSNGLTIRGSYFVLQGVLQSETNGNMIVSEFLCIWWPIDS